LQQFVNSGLGLGQSTIQLRFYPMAGLVNLLARMHERLPGRRSTGGKLRIQVIDQGMDCLFAAIGKLFLSIYAGLNLIEGLTNFVLVLFDAVAVVFVFLQCCLEASAGTKFGELYVGRLSDFLYDGHGSLSF
jgi:hypothetical protein